MLYLNLLVFLLISSFIEMRMGFKSFSTGRNLNSLPVCRSVNSEYHVPVMRDLCCSYLLSENYDDNKVFVDCTLGGGGHTKAILEKGCKVIAIDQDYDSIKLVSKKLSNYIEQNQLEIINTNFRNIKSAVANSKLSDNGLVDGILMDLGISSHQIDVPERGFAFSMDGPLDMRMQKETEVDSGITAAYIVNNYDEKTIADILFNYGDEKCSRKLAREIVACRPIHTTGKLVEVLSRVTPWKERTKMLARCFQALRIEVNDEIGALEEALSNTYKIVKPSGRLVIMSYHSLEDKRVKSLLKYGFPDEKYASSSNFENPWNSLFKKAIIPSDDEITLNKRARSAKLRVGERVSVGEELLASNPFMGTLESKKSKYTPGLVGEKQKNKFFN